MLEAEEISVLETTTEGWIAGLQLAALSMKVQDDRTGFIRSFTGSHRFVLDYLADEVLHREPEAIQAFLIRTSILDRLCGPLCDAMIDGSSGQETLDYLERSNLFIVHLDGERKWYRYHRMFKEFLGQWLRQDRAGSAGSVADLCLRASRWPEESGLCIEAFKYATAAGDLDRAQSRIASGKLPKHSRESVITILDWLASLPTETLGAAELLLLRTGPVDTNPDLHGSIATARAVLSIFRYQPDEIMIQSARALQQLEPFSAAMEAKGWQEERLMALSLQALAVHAAGRDDEACSLLSQALKLADAGGCIRLFLDEGEPMESLIALDTIKGHNRRIFDKLDVKRRTEALARASELGLL